MDYLNRRILLVDDNDAIHGDFRKILASEAAQAAGASLRSAFLGGEAKLGLQVPHFDMRSTRQGQEALEEVLRAVREERPYALAFVDVRMPPGWDGVETIAHLWEVDPCMQVVICTAYSDYSLDEIVGRLGQTDRLLVLKKPFDPVEVRQIANALTVKWNGEASARLQMDLLRDTERRAREYATSLEESNRALELARRDAEAASRAKSDFLANMSHEIRTPMTAILGYTDLIADGSVGREEKERYAAIVRKSSEHLLTILNDVLDISKIEAGKMSLALRRFSPLELCRELIALMRVRAEERGLELSLETRGRIPEAIESDPIRLRQILLNLVGNAIKFTERGSVRLVIGLEDPRNRPAPALRFDVVDTGVGIEKTQLTRLFEAFRQADGSSTRTAGGTGLGLTISRRLARMLGGDIEVRSEPGGGSTFSVWLQIVETGTPELATESLRAITAAVHPEPWVGALSGRVLLVEDTPLNQLLISTILRKAGVEVALTENGAEGCREVARAQAAGEPYDLILMDMQMPVLDGYEAARRLRKEGCELPILALTAHAMLEDRDKCLEAGCTDYAPKPIQKDDLLRKCAQWLAPVPVAAPLPRRQHRPQRSTDC